MTLPDRIRLIREARLFTQADIAYACDVSPSAYGQIERRAESASIKTLQKVANALGVSIAFLVDMEREVSEENTSYSLLEP